MTIKEELPPGEVAPEEIQAANMEVSASFSDMFKPVIGPLGSKILITQGATKIEAADLISSNALSLVKELKYQHPTADILLNAGLTQGERVGDGIAAVMVLMGELVKKGYELRALGVHQNKVINGYEMALEVVKAVLSEIASPVEVRGKGSDAVLRKVAKTALKKGDFGEGDRLVDTVVESIKRLRDSDDNEPIEVEDIVIETKSGSRVHETTFLEGVVIDREVLDALPTEIENARIALLDFPIEHKEPRIKGRKELKTGTGARERSKAGQTLGALEISVKFSEPSHFKEFREARAKLFDEVVDPVINCGANVICCRWGVDDDALDKFRDAGIMLIKRVKLTDLMRLERSTKGKIVKDISVLSEDKFGVAGRVVQRKIGGDNYVFIEDCARKKSATILIRGTTLRILEGLVGEIRSALHAVAQLFVDARVVPGGGAVEMECAHQLRKAAKKVPGKEQLAMEAFADAIETIPLAIAKNSGMNHIDTLTKLRAEHFDGNRNAGISGLAKQVKSDMMAEDIIDPLTVKLQAFISATEAAARVMKIDDLHIARSAARDEAADIESQIAGRTRDLIDTERQSDEFKSVRGGRVNY